MRFLHCLSKPHKTLLSLNFIPASKKSSRSIYLSIIQIQKYSDFWWVGKML
ncbi:hypothetical protein Hdeb2414_s0007g00262341 [Helianthus debilis subsp. tardiflorus]